MRERELAFFDTARFRRRTGSNNQVGNHRGPYEIREGAYLRSLDNAGRPACLPSPAPKRIQRHLALQAGAHIATLTVAVALAAMIFSEHSCAGSNKGMGTAICKAIGADANVSHLALEDVHARRTSTAGRPVLLLEGTVVLKGKGVSNHEAQAPAKLWVSLTDTDNRRLYSWPVEIPPGRLQQAPRYNFAARLESPPEGARNAMVTFVANEGPNL